jgi:molybdopterin-binding protein
MRNRFRGLVSRVLRDGREAADEFVLEPGVLAAAAIKATNVFIEIPSIR